MLGRVNAGEAENGTQNGKAVLQAPSANGTTNAPKRAFGGILSNVGSASNVASAASKPAIASAAVAENDIEYYHPGPALQPSRITGADCGLNISKKLMNADGRIMAAAASAPPKYLQMAQQSFAQPTVPLRATHEAVKPRVAKGKPGFSVFTDESERLDKYANTVPIPTTGSRGPPIAGVGTTTALSGSAGLVGALTVDGLDLAGLGLSDDDIIASFGL